MKDKIEEKIVLFVIGVLVGAIISTGAFLVYTKSNHTKRIDNNTMQMQGGNQPTMQGGQNNQNGQPPSMPNDQNNQSTDQNSQNTQPPEKPSDSNSQNNN